jgi:hypothetical protein
VAGEAIVAGGIGWFNGRRAAELRFAAWKGGR